MAGQLTSGTGYADESAPMAGINVTPLVDVTLVLLIVFMITVPAIVGTAPVKVDLPESTSVAAALEQMPIMFALRRDDTGKLQLYLNERPVESSEVKDALALLGPINDDQRVSLAADQTIPYGQVVEVMDMLHALGLKKLSLDTRHVEAP